MSNLEEKLEKFVNASQAVMAGIILLCIVLLVVVNLVRGCVQHWYGILLCGGFVWLSWVIAKSAYREYRESKAEEER